MGGRYLSGLASATEPRIPVSDFHDAAAHCENCATPLDAAFCPVCGQSRVNPIRHAGHALEEVFESLWHLDGRVFRTLRDLVVPGRVACNYIAGHRMRYVAPLRLFFVLSVLTFFVAQSVVHLEKGAVKLDPADAPAVPAFADARTVDAVVRSRDAQIAEIRDAQKALAPLPFARGSLDKSVEMIEAGAAARINAIDAGTLPPPIPAAVLRVDEKDNLFEDRAKSPDNPVGMVIDGKPWHIDRNPVVIDGWPRVTRWFNARVAVAVRNAPRVNDDPDLLKNAILKSIPAALLVLVPVFALLLKIAYMRRGRLYLEHLTVALYSHAFLCIGILGVCALTWLQNTSSIAAFDTVLSVLKGLLWAWLPVYLLLTQRQAYGQGWLRTTLKFGVLGAVYATVLMFALVPVFLVAFLRV